MKKILLLEDDMSLAEALKRFLTQEGFELLHAQSIHEAQTLLAKRPDLILLDWMLPESSGLDFLKQVRHHDHQTPILFLTARVDVSDKVIGLELGADDYITKPFDPKELVARIRARLRIFPAQKANVSVWKIELRDKNKEVFFDDQKIELTKMEYLVLKLFLENPNQVFSRDELLNRVWGYDTFPTTRTVDNHILQLRQKFPGIPLETLRGMGYRFVTNT